MSTTKAEAEAEIENLQLTNLEVQLRTLQLKTDDRARRLGEQEWEMARLSREIDPLKKEVAVLEALVREAFATEKGQCLLPPEDLRLHVGTKTTAANFWAQGCNSARRVIEVFGPDPGGPVLDWGCGSGRTLNWLLGRGSWSQYWQPVTQMFTGVTVFARSAHVMGSRNKPGGCG